MHAMYDYVGTHADQSRYLWLQKELTSPACGREMAVALQKICGEWGGRVQCTVVFFNKGGVCMNCAG